MPGTTATKSDPVNAVTVERGEQSGERAAGPEGGQAQPDPGLLHPLLGAIAARPRAGPGDRNAGAGAEALPR